MGLRPRTGAAIERSRHDVDDPELSAALDAEGYAVVPLLDPDQIERVKAIRARYGSAPGDPRTGLFNDTWSSDRTYRERVATELRAVVASALESTMASHRALGFVHIVKWPGADGAVVAHRDPTFVDERRFRSLMVWCALDDLDDDVGTLWVVPGSHRRSELGIRAHGAESNLAPGVDLNHHDARPVALRAGSAVVYDHELIHLSGPNRSGVERVVIAGPLVPRAAVASYPLRLDDGGVVQVEIDDDFFVDNQLADPDVEAMVARYRLVGADPT